MNARDDSTSETAVHGQRRRFLRVLGAAGAAGVAGCLGDEDDGDDSDDTGDGENGDGDRENGDNGDNGDPDPAFFEVSGLDPTGPSVTRGESAEVNATVENTGDEERTQTVALTVGGEEVSSEELTIGGGSSSDVTFEIDTGDYEPGDYDFAVSSDDSEATGTLTVEEEATAVFEILEFEPADTAVVAGETVTPTVTLENTGNASGEQEVEYRVDGNTELVETVELSWLGTETIQFSEGFDTGSLEAGTYDHGIYTEDDEVTGEIEIVDAFVEVTDVSPSVLMLEGSESGDVTVEFENAGSTETTQELAVYVDDSEVYNDEVTFDGEGTVSITVEDISADDYDDGDYRIEATSEDDTADAVLVVNQPSIPPHLDDSSLGWWPALAGDGTELTDWLGELDGALDSDHGDGPAWVGGEGFGYHLEFDPESAEEGGESFGGDWVSLGEESRSAMKGFSAGEEASFGAWVRLDDDDPDVETGEYTPIIAGTGVADTSGPGWNVRVEATEAGNPIRVLHRIDDAWGVSFRGGEITIGEWHSVVLTSGGEGEEMTLYVDGEEVATHELTAVDGDDLVDDVVFGYDDADVDVDPAHWQGGLDRFWYATEELSASAVSDWHDATQDDYA